jgi:SAM-dependent methyltransferase
MSTRELFERYYFARPEYEDFEHSFRGFLRTHIPRDARMLELGAGPGGPTSQFLAEWSSELFAADVSPEVGLNPFPIGAVVFDGNSLPIADASIDACVSDYVLEHVENPDTHFREVARVLRPGGVYVFRTPNLFHYVPIGARLIPNWAHNVLSKRLRGLSDESHDVYPTFYRANTERAVKALARRSELTVASLVFKEPAPAYGAGSPALFYPMMLYERAVNASDALRNFRVNMFCALVKGSKTAA